MGSTKARLGDPYRVVLVVLDVVVACRLVVVACRLVVVATGAEVVVVAWMVVDVVVAPGSFKDGTQSSRR
jgi:hypothetical protein